MAASADRSIVRLPGVMQMTGLRKDSIYTGAREGTFPRPIKLSSQASGWLKAEVEEWITRKMAERGETYRAAPIGERVDSPEAIRGRSRNAAKATPGAR